MWKIVPYAELLSGFWTKQKKAVLVTLTIPPEQQPMARGVQRFLSGPQPEQEQAA